MTNDLSSMSLEQAAQALCHESGVTMATMTEKSIGGALLRGGFNCFAPVRAKIWYTLRNVQTGAGPKWTLPEIARAFGTKHSTVITAIRRYEAKLAQELVTQ